MLPCSELSTLSGAVDLFRDVVKISDAQIDHRDSAAQLPLSARQTDINQGTFILSSLVLLIFLSALLPSSQCHPPHAAEVARDHSLHALYPTLLNARRRPWLQRDIRSSPWEQSAERSKRYGAALITICLPSSLTHFIIVKCTSCRRRGHRL